MACKEASGWLLPAREAVDDDVGVEHRPHVRYTFCLTVELVGSGSDQELVAMCWCKS